MTFKNIRTQLFLFTIAALLFTALLISFAYIEQFRGVYREALADRSITIARNLRETVYRNLEFFSLDSLTGMSDYLQASLEANEGISYSYITDKNGRILYHSDASRAGQMVAPAIHASGVFDDPTAEVTLSVRDYYESIIPVVSAGEVIGAVHLGVEKNVVESEIVGIIVRGGGILILALIILGVPLSWLLSRRFATPLVRLTETALEIADGDLDRKVELEREDEIGALARAFNSMTAQLRELIDSLEQRVTERTRDLERRSAYLEASAEVNRVAASILETEDLIQQVVEFIRDRFDLYHISLYLVDDTGRWADLRASAGEAAQALMEKGLRLEVGGHSMIGWCTANAQPRIAHEASQDTIRLELVELSEVRSEVALPLIARGQVLGALDVLSDQPGFFDQDAITVLQIMAGQVAVALDNARLFSESKAALETARRAYGEFGRQTLLELLQSRPDLGYYYTQGSVKPAFGGWEPDMLQAVQVGQAVEKGDKDALELTVPLKVRNQVVGALSFCKEGADDKEPVDPALLQTLTEQVEAALESAWLFDETQRRAAREQLVSEVSARVGETMDIDTILQSTVQELGRALGLAEVVIQLEAADGMDAPPDERGVEDSEEGMG